MRALSAADAWGSGSRAPNWWHPRLHCLSERGHGRTGETAYGVEPESGRFRIMVSPGVV
jgi:hypothetical protein